MPARKPKEVIEEVVEDKSRGMVSVERSFTKNMENFNSAKVTVTITAPVNPTKQELKDIDATVTILNEHCEKFLSSELDKLVV